MTIATLSSRQMNQDTRGAETAAAEGPVVVTDPGTLDRPDHCRLRHILLFGGVGEPAGQSLPQPFTGPGGRKVRAPADQGAR